MAEAAFLTALSPKKKGRNGQDVPILEAPIDPREAGGTVGGSESEETEEDVAQSLEEVKAVATTDSTRQFAGLLLKIRGFVTKVRDTNHPLIVALLNIAYLTHPIGSAFSAGQGIFQEVLHARARRVSGAAPVLQDALGVLERCARTSFQTEEGTYRPQWLKTLAESLHDA